MLCKEVKFEALVKLMGVKLIGKVNYPVLNYSR